MRIFIAGGNGALGRSAIRALVAAGHDVRASARSTAAADLIRACGGRPIALNLFDTHRFDELVAGADAVLNLATKIPRGSEMRDPEAWTDNHRIRRQVSRALVDAAIKVGSRRYLQESITYFYADGGDQWLTEASQPDPTPTLASALDAEREAARFAATGREAVVLRLAGFYAAYAQSTLDMIEAARDGSYPVFGTGKNYFSTTHVDDAGRAVAAALTTPGGTYNVADDEPLTMWDFVNAMTQAFGLSPPHNVPKEQATAFLGDASSVVLRSQRVSNQRFKECSGWMPRYRNAREGWRAIADQLCRAVG
ncbi:MAG: NAD-dependent epimerase/dehydratase family protein [Candidatus Binataceae bacterium]